MSTKHFQEFNTETIKLSGSNLIEASAGTGKTYSIAILVIRLLLENKLLLPEILMLTFTKAAVAELEGRIRQVINQSYMYLYSNNECDQEIQKIVDKSVIQTSSHSCLEILSKAKKQLDETSIFTIHGFCQLTLNEFAFETKQTYNCEITTNEIDIVSNIVNKYWRREISTINTEDLKILLDNKFNKTELENIVIKALSGKKFVKAKESESADIFTNIKNQYKNIELLRESFSEFFSSSAESNIENINTNTYAKNKFASIHNNSDLFLDTLIENKDKKYIEKTFPELLNKSLLISEAEYCLEHDIKNIIITKYSEAIPIIEQEIKDEKNERHIYTYDDLINKLHEAIINDKSDYLKKALNNKYKAVFIDEFQDTDKKQYEIFDITFGQESIVFYIGDPKQSIYSFRGADIDTYKLASQRTEKAFSMRTNYRSNEKLNMALNSFFGQANNIFIDDEIKYENVSTGREIIPLSFEGKSIAPLNIFSCKNKSQVKTKTTLDIINILNNEYYIDNRRICPSDIAVLVRTRSEAAEIKESLSKLNIPSVNVDESMVLQSDEALEIYYILSACIDINRSNMSIALLNKFTGYNKSSILNMDEETELNTFRILGQKWIKEGVYSCISFFMEHYGTHSKVKSERSLSNILQIKELLHKVEKENNYSPGEILSYLANIFEGAIPGDDEYAQRIESDDDAVQIITIHKSKGLSFNIVFAPYLNLKSSFSQASMIEYKDENNVLCFSKHIDDREKELYQQQNEKENRRLIYVSMTRAVYALYIYNYGKLGIAKLINEYDNDDNINTLENIYNNDIGYVRVINKKTKTARVFKNKTNTNWQLSSYSSINKYHDHKYIQAAVLQTNDEYDKFVFHSMPKGALAGNFIHDILENINFGNIDHEKIISKIGKSYPSLFDEEQLSKYNSLINNILESNYGSEEKFHLTDINPDKKIAELEFYFDINKADTKEIFDICNITGMHNRTKLEGMMTGFIDLFFEYNNKYYILDWKSNHISYTAEGYNTENLETSIIDNNYNLQYYIYCVAIKRYLEKTKPDFNYEKDFGGVLYVYIRACRKDKEHGVYFTKPDKRTIETLDECFS